MPLVTKQDLKNYRALVREISTLTEELDSIYQRTTSATAQASEVPGRGSSKRSDLSDPVVKMIELEELIRAKYDTLVKERRRIEEAVDRLDSRERDLIRKRYILGWGWVKIALQLEISISVAYEVHGRALQKLS